MNNPLAPTQTNVTNKHLKQKLEMIICTHYKSVIGIACSKELAWRKPDIRFPVKGQGVSVYHGYTW